MLGICPLCHARLNRKVTYLIYKEGYFYMHSVKDDKLVSKPYFIQEAVKRTFPIINNIDLKRMKLSQTRENHIILKY